MVTEDQIRESLKEVLLPGVIRNLPELNLVRALTVSGQRVDVTLASTALNFEMQDWVRAKTRACLEKLPGISEVGVEFTEVKPAELNRVKQVLAVMSGKGGVGKSAVASLIAVALRRQGYEVGILDADITGPSIPRMFGITSRPIGNETGMLPVTSKSGIEIASFHLLVPQKDEAVVWRGPLMSMAVTYFWENVVWGNLDYLVVDLPPGTADIPLTVMQTLPISGVILVFTPQDLTTMIVRKAVQMVRVMDKPILGVIENMSFLYVPEIDRRIDVFGKSKGVEMAQLVRAPLLGQLPIDPELAKLCDEGEVERYTSDAFTALAQNLTQTLSKVVTAKTGDT